MHDLGLIINPSGTYLYYRGLNGLIYRFLINNNWNYSYSAMPTNSAMQQQGITAVYSFICPLDNRLYYVANESLNGNTKRIHGLILNNGLWSTVSPSWSAHINGQNILAQEVAFNKLVCSNDNLTLAYLGMDKEMHGFNIKNDFDYSYFDFKSTPLEKKPRESLIFNDENKLFYISSILGDDKVHFFEFGDDNCGHDIVQDFEPGCCSYSMSNTAELNDSSNNNSIIKFREELPIKPNLNLLLYPNPCTDGIVNLYIEEDNINLNSKVNIIDVHGASVLIIEHLSDLNPISFKVDDLPKGCYFVRVQSGHHTEILKLIIASSHE